MPALERLPIHGIPPMALDEARDPVLVVAGLVARPLRLTPADVATLPRVEYAGTFSCEEGWEVPDLRWQGVLLSDLLALAGPLPDARFVRVSAGPYATPLPIEDAASALLCDALGDRPLTVAHGAPWRLVCRGGQCFTSVKWVSRIEVTSEPGDDTAQRLALARIRAT